MREELFAELLESVREGGAILRGQLQPSREFRFDEPDVRALREGYGLSQTQFAALLGISPGTLRNWEQGRRKPEGSARVLLRAVCLTHAGSGPASAGLIATRCKNGRHRALVALDVRQIFVGPWARRIALTAAGLAVLAWWFLYKSSTPVRYADLCITATLCSFLPLYNPHRTG